VVPCSSGRHPLIARRHRHVPWNCTPVIVRDGVVQLHYGFKAIGTSLGRVPNRRPDETAVPSKHGFTAFGACTGAWACRRASALQSHLRARESIWRERLYPPPEHDDRTPVRLPRSIDVMVGSQTLSTRSRASQRAGRPVESPPPLNLRLLPGCVRTSPAISTGVAGDGCQGACPAAPRRSACPCANASKPCLLCTAVSSGPSGWYSA